MRYLLSGYYGYGNPGDEAVLAAVVRDLRATDPEAEVRVLSADPAGTAQALGVEAVPRADLRAVVEGLRWAHLLVSGGGSLLQDVTSHRSIYYYLGILKLAHWCRRPYFIYAQGIGPIRRPLARWATARVLARAAGITVRDPGSAQLLAELGVRRPVLVTADPVFSLPPPGDDVIRATWASLGLEPDRRAVVAVLRPWPGQDAGATWPEVGYRLGRLAAALEAPLVFVPFQAALDQEVAEACARAAREVGGPAPVAVAGAARTFAEAWAWVAGARSCLAMRLHALIFAAVAGVPAVAVGYDPKVVACARLVDEVCLEGWSGLEPALAAAWEAGALGDARERRRRRAAELGATARCTAELAVAAARADALGQA